MSRELKKNHSSIQFLSLKMFFPVSSQHISSAVIFFLIVVMCCSIPKLCAAETERPSPINWSFRIGNLDLFNIPVFGRSLFGGVTEGYSDLNNLEASRNEIDPDVIEDSFLRTPDLIKKYGYPVEVHRVITEDGYILQMHRIPNNGGIPVLLTHGLLDSSATFVMMGPDKGLAYFLYDLGYDVWMTNVRGNTYSRNHTRYSTKDAIYWDFTFHEIGKYDLPASIDYVLQTTKRQQLHYIGHSQGTVTFWVMCSEHPEYTEKVALMQAMAPVAFIEHCKSPVVNFLAFFQEPISFLLRMIGAHEFLPSNEFITMFSQMICDDYNLTREMCTNVIFLVTGFDKAQMNETMLPVILGHTPAGAATKQMLHYGQLKHSGQFRQFDYGWLKNKWRYGTYTPPKYELQNVKNKVALHYSQNDWLTTPEDVEHLHQQLPNVIGKFLVNDPEFNHLDFVWGVDARQRLYERMTKLMDLVERGEF